MPGVTYGQLDDMLRSLGFSLRGEHEKNKVYLHEGTGALVMFPAFPDSHEVLPRHLLLVRTTLDNYGIAVPIDLAAKLQRVS
jgi:hypothetical protein